MQEIGRKTIVQLENIIQPFRGCLHFSRLKASVEPHHKYLPKFSSSFLCPKSCRLVLSCIFKRDCAGHLHLQQYFPIGFLLFRGAFPNCHPHSRLWSSVDLVALLNKCIQHTCSAAEVLCLPRHSGAVESLQL